MGGKISGVILAGGSGSRFNGLMKPKIVIEGMTIISRMISVMRDIFDEIIIVTNDPEEFADFNFCLLVPDRITNAGPLGGIHAAMLASSGEAIFVFAGDMPFLDKEIIMSQIEAFNNIDADALIPRIDNYIEPLHSIYGISLAERIETHINSNRSQAVRDFIKSLKVHYLQFDSSEKNKKAFTNINSSADIN
jgi:molybdenum cofactor guanylyltransferase